MGIVGYTAFCTTMFSACVLLIPERRRTAGGGDAVMKVIRRHVVSKGLYLDIFWQLQSVVWIYRAGGFGLVLSFMLGMCSVVGVVLVEVGCRLTPDIFHWSPEHRNATIVGVLADDGVELGSSSPDVHHNGG